MSIEITCSPNSSPSAARIKNIELYLLKLPKRFSDPVVHEWLRLVQQEYEATGDVNERDFKTMWNMYVGSSPLNRHSLESDINDKLNAIFNPMKPRWGGS